MILTRGLGVGGGLPASGFGAWIGITVAEAPDGGSADNARRYRAPIREGDARKNYNLVRPVDASQQDGIAIPAPQGYDSIGAQVAPRVGESPVLHAVAPALKDVAKSIQITQQVLQGITSAAALKSRQRQDDEAAALALFALMMDDD
jgi:hypothetical protein